VCAVEYKERHTYAFGVGPFFAHATDVQQVSFDSTPFTLEACDNRGHQVDCMSARQSVVVLQIVHTNDTMYR
jgi:hypothetical protein